MFSRSAGIWKSYFMPRLHRRIKRNRAIAAPKTNLEKKPKSEKRTRVKDDVLSDCEDSVEAPEYTKNEVNGTNTNATSTTQCCTDDGMIITSQLSEQIKERYQELIKELWNNEKKICEFDLPDDLRNALNTRSKLFLEYFITNATFRTPDANLFEYLDTFSSVTTFI